jgi:hypothetical protein
MENGKMTKKTKLELLALEIAMLNPADTGQLASLLVTKHTKTADVIQNAINCELQELSEGVIKSLATNIEKGIK